MFQTKVQNLEIWNGFVQVQIKKVYLFFGAHRNQKFKSEFIV